MDMAEMLLGLECPMNWGLEEALSSMNTNTKKETIELERKCVIKIVTDKIGCDSDYCRIDGSVALQKCSQYLTMAWLHYGLPENSESQTEKHLDKADDFIAYAVSEINLITRYKKALRYLFNAMWAHLYYQKKNFDETHECLDLITPFDDLDDPNQAAVFALKACVFMEFGPGGHFKALEAISKALELENAAEWHFLKGKCLSRRRRAQNFESVPLDEELFHLRKALEMNQGSASASHYVFCGQSVREYASYSPTARLDRSVQDALMDECHEYFVLASLLNDDSPIILTRIAKGLMHMKGDRGADLLEHSVLRSLELLPESGLVNHVAGNYYMYRKRDTKRAVYHLEKAALNHGIYGAFINLIDLVWRTKTEKNLELLVEKYWESFREDPINRVKAAGLMASFYFFVKNDITKSIFFWRGVLQSVDGNDGRVYSFVRGADLTKLLVGEVQTRLRNLRSNISSDEEDTMRSFLSEVLEARPTLDIARNLTTREEFIQSALTRMPVEFKKVVAPKLSDQFTTTAYRIPAKRVERIPERILPTNWRQP